MKILLCGKGGCGKSTLSVLLALGFASQGKKVLIIDMDESNYGLHRQLGVDLPQDFTMYFGSKKGIYKTMDDPANDGKAFDKKWHIEDVPEGFYSSRDGIRLMCVGKIHDAGEGCACAMGTVASTLLENFELNDDEVIIADTEAGVEHFGRGVDRHCDKIFMIVDPSFESIHLSEKISKMGDQFGKPVYFIVNKADEAKVELIKKAIANPEKIIVAVKDNTDLAMRGLLGERIEEVPEEITELVSRL